MKNLYMLSISTFLVGNLFAQPTMQSTDLNLQAGDNFTIVSSSWNSPGSSGGNQTWNFSSMPNSGTNYTISVTANNSGSYAPANLIMATSAGSQSSTGYILANTTELSQIASIGGGTTMTYSDPMKMLVYPLTSITNVTDNFEATFQSNGVDFERTGTSMITVDGWGTLTTPSGTFTNVFRVKNELEYQDEVMGQILEYSSVTYSWYKAGIHYALASFSEVTALGNTTQSGQYLLTGNLGLEDKSAITFDISPNPVSDFIKIKLPDHAIDQVQVTDLSGKVIAIHSNLLADTELSFSVSDLNQGTYFVSLVNQGRQIATQKVVKL